MLAHAIDNPAPSTIVLISGDRDFAYALAMLRLRCYRVILITLSNAHSSLRAQASLHFDWISDVLEPVEPTLSHCHLTSPSHHGKTSSLSTRDKFYSDLKCHNLSRCRFQELCGEKTASNVEFDVNCIQDTTRRTENSRTSPSPKHEARQDFLLPRESERLEPVSTAGPDALGNDPEPATVTHSPVASSYHTCIEMPLTMTACDSNPSGTIIISNAHAGNMSSRVSTHCTLKESTSSLDLVEQHEVTNVTEPMLLPPAELDLASLSSQQQRSYSPINFKTQSLLGVDQMGENNGDLRSEISRPDVTTPVPASPPCFMLPSSLSNATTEPAVAESSVKAAIPPQPPTSDFPVVPDAFKILIQCLKSHRSKGRLRPLRSPVSVEIACNGATYRQAGVLKFRHYVAMAEKAGIVELGGSESTAWIALKAPWYDVPIA